MSVCHIITIVMHIHIKVQPITIIPQNMPTDDDLLAVATEIIKILQDNWTILQSFLNIPDHIMLDILSETTMHQQVFRYRRMAVTTVGDDNIHCTGWACISDMTFSTK